MVPHQRMIQFLPTNIFQPAKYTLHHTSHHHTSTKELNIFICKFSVYRHIHLQARNSEVPRFGQQGRLCRMSAQDILLKWVFPLLGGVVGTLMFMAPMRAVLTARKERVLGVRIDSASSVVFVLLVLHLILD